jgi:probable F420-dependent oxidoreductase
MQIGAVFPQTEIGNDLVLLRDYLQTLEGAGCSHALLYDHVLGADPNRPGGWNGPYSSENPFHEPFVFLAWAAALTQRIELVTGIIILPQRQTVLVAKQAAELDLLSQGRLRLGVGLGWNQIEYEGLGQDFHTRGRRMEAQIGLLRRLWSEPVLEVHDKWHSIDKAGISPRPNRQVPIWMGGMNERVLDRTARLADGWLPQGTPDDKMKAAIERLRENLSREGRDPAAFPFEGRVDMRVGDADEQVKQAKAWQDLGASFVSISTMRAGLKPADHIEVVRRFKEAWDKS